MKEFTIFILCFVLSQAAIIVQNVSEPSSKTNFSQFELNSSALHTHDADPLLHSSLHSTTIDDVIYSPLSKFSSGIRSITTIQDTSSSAKLISIESQSLVPSPAVPSSALPLTSVYQPLIHLEDKSKNDILNYLAGAKNPNISRLFEKFRKSPTSVPRSPPSLKTENALSQKQLRSIFKLARVGSPSLLRCRLPEATISIKCFSNLAKIVVSSDSETRFDAQISLFRSDHHILLDGYKLNTYLTWWTNGSEVKTELSSKLKLDQVRRKCHRCFSMEVLLLLQGEDHACLIPVNCGSNMGETVLTPGSDSTSGNPGRNVPFISTSLALHHAANSKDGNLAVEEIASGSEAKVLIRASSDVLSVGLYVKSCSVSVPGGQRIPLLSNGCSISNMIENFKVSPAPNAKGNVFVISATMFSYAIDSSSQNLTFICSVMVCDGSCLIQSSCQKGLSHYEAVGNSEVIETVSIGVKYRVITENYLVQGRGQINSSTNGNVSSIVHSEAKACLCPITDKSSWPRNTCYIYLSLLATFNVVLLVIAMGYFNYKRVAKTRIKFREEIESPSRMFYYEQSSARKRSPNSSSIIDFTR